MSVQQEVDYDTFFRCVTREWFNWKTHRKELFAKIDGWVSERLCAMCSKRLYVGDVYIHDTATHSCSVAHLFGPAGHICERCLLIYLELETTDDALSPKERLALLTEGEVKKRAWRPFMEDGGSVIPCRVKRYFNNTKSARNKPFD